MFKQLSLLSLLLVGLNADNINMQNAGTITNYGTINNVQNNDSEKAKFDLRINELINTTQRNITQDQNQEEQNTRLGVIKGAQEANQYNNLTAKQKTDHCVEYSVSFKAYGKFDLKLARNECDKIFLN